VTELLEGVMPPAVAHEAGKEPNCPFCPAPEPKALKTYGGADNDSGTLETIMTNPGKLLAQQTNTWPHPGKASRSREDIEGAHVHPTYGKYEFQAHHLVSGNQALKGSPYEEWILQEPSSTIKKDTGYTVNGSLNGIWAPSYPKSFRAKEYEWKELTPSERMAIAVYVMDKAKCQFHLGHHSIDPQDDGKEIHEKYDKYLKDNLEDMAQRMFSWAKVCPLCEKKSNGEPKKPLWPNQMANIYLNNLSEVVRKRVTEPKDKWMVFLSALARDYHKKHCTHGDAL
jgi:hypothetical protein